jgi:hypothetical protein
MAEAKSDGVHHMGGAATQKKEETKKAILTSSNTRAMQPKMQAAEVPYIVVIEP